ncbi:hypothetical protein ACTXT7_013629 [Hymenolepis weldensis]
MSGKRHFSTKRTSLFGSENEKDSQLPDLSKNFAKSTIFNKAQKSFNYGDWWRPMDRNSTSDTKPQNEAQFYGRQRLTDSTLLCDIEGFKNGLATSDTINCSNSNNKANSSTSKEVPLDKNIYEVNGQSSCINNAVLSDNEKLSDFESAHGDIMDAKNCSKERHQQEDFCENSKNHFINSENFNNSSQNNGFMVPNFEMVHLTLNDSNESQKELLGRKMVEREPEAPSLRPPWFTEELAASTRTTLGQRIKPESEKKCSFQRSCNQIEFPSYTPEEMRSARPVMIDARSRKSTWMPSLAPEFVAQNNFGKRPILQEKKASPRCAKDINLPPYPKLTAPYAMD